MKWFDTYVSNTIGGSGNQLYFRPEDDAPRTGRIYYKVFAGGKYNYSLLFSNIIDSTYKVEYGSWANYVLDEWEILDAKIGLCREVSDERAGEVEAFVPLTFGGKREKTVMPGEFFTSDPVELDAPKDAYICYQITFRGRQMPYHLETVLPTFVEKDGEWISDKRVPPPAMIGCDRKVKARIGYSGDSITQGIGTPPNGYTHWNALVSEALGEEYSYWNLGLGYGRGQDAATGGAWFYKAKHMDAVVLTYGSNDVGRGRTLEQMKTDAESLVERLKAEGIRVFLQTLPPFDWKDEYLERWKAINAWLVEELSEKTDGLLDVAPLLTCEPMSEGLPKYGKHPDEKGCRIWAEKLIPLMREFLKDI